MTLSTQTSPASPSASTDAPVTVLVADDHPLFRRGLARAINRHRALDLVGEAVDGAEALELIELLRPDVAVLDFRMPRMTGAQVSAALRRCRGTRTAVLILSAFEDAPLVRAAVGAGAAGYISKTASQGEICAAIERVGRGGVAYGSPAVPPRTSIADDTEIF